MFFLRWIIAETHKVFPIATICYGIAADRGVDPQSMRVPPAPAESGPAAAETRRHTGAVVETFGDSAAANLHGKLAAYCFPRLAC